MYSNLSKAFKNFSTKQGSKNPFGSVFKTLKVGNQSYQYYSLPDLKDNRLGNHCESPYYNQYLIRKITI